MRKTLGTSVPFSYIPRDKGGTVICKARRFFLMTKILLDEWGISFLHMLNLYLNVMMEISPAMHVSLSGKKANQPDLMQLPPS